MKQRFTVRHGALDGIEAFLGVAEHRNFRRAAAALGVTPSAISQAVRTLETRLGVPLFTRTTRSVGMTEAGQRFLSRARPAFDELAAASEVARELGRGPSGLLRLAVPRAVMPVLLQPLIASFCRAYPGVQVEIAASEELIDLAAEGFDAGIRMGQFIAADMTALRLSPPFPMSIVGSPEYFANHAPPQAPEDLHDHACLRWRRSNTAIALWTLKVGNRPMDVAVNGPLIANDFSTLLGAVLEGVGLAQLPRPIAREALGDGRLIEVLAPFAPSTPGVFLYYPSRQQMLPRLRAFVDHLKAEIGRRDRAASARAKPRSGGAARRSPP